MKVALLLPGFSSHERDWCIPVLLDYVRVLSQAHEVHVFTLRWPERQARYRVFGADVRALGGAPRLGARAVGLWARATRAIAEEHRRAPFDVLHAFWADEPGWVAALAGAWLRVPVVLSVAGGELVSLPDIDYGLQLLPGRRALVGWLLRRAHTVTGGSDYVLAQARRQLPPRRHHRLCRAPLGVDLERFRAPVNRAYIPCRLAINVGALFPVKNHALLLRVAARVPGLTVQVAGEGPLLVALQAQASALGIAERVSFLGPVDHGALPDLYGAAGLFLQASRHEAQGMAVLEAAACGVAPIGTPVGVLPELGLPAADEASLAAALQELIADPARRSAVAQSARERVAAEFSLPVALNRFERLYDQAAA